MRNALIITVAGTSKRFRESIGSDVLKCLYTIPPNTSMLGRQLSLGLQNGFNRIVIVGGYRFNDLVDFLSSYKPDILNLSLIYNDKFEVWGSNYSLYLGLIEVFKDKEIDRVVFAEGDLVFDEDSFMKVCNSSKDVITANCKNIIAETCVLMYFDVNGNVKYCYDTNHKYFEINEPFQSVYNSAQVWAFSNVEKLIAVVNSLNNSDLDDTNLNIIQKYFNESPVNGIEVVKFHKWFNCNTVEDYIQSMK